MTGEPCRDVVRWRRAILAERRLPPGAKVVAIVLHEHMDWRGEHAGGRCFPSLATLAGEAGTSQAAVKRAVAALCAADFIDRVPGGGRGHATRYQATLPADKQAQPGPVSPRAGAAETGPERTETGPEWAQKQAQSGPRPTSTNQQTFRSSSGSPNGDSPRPSGSKNGQPLRDPCQMCLDGSYAVTERGKERPCGACGFSPADVRQWKGPPW